MTGRIKEEPVILIPYGAARLRIKSFSVVAGDNKPN
jgi:hypothetical protein